jgi:hypothetical protein
MAMHFTQERLKDFYQKKRPSWRGKPFQMIRLFNRHPLPKSCLASLIPYFDLAEDLPENIASIKIDEALSILGEIDKDIDGLFANFDEPGKINLSDFMERHYMFNMPL